MGTEEDLLADYSRRGRVESLSALVSSNAVWMLAFLRGMLRSDHDAEDAFQNVWLRVIKSASSYNGGSVKAYLTKIARSVAIDMLRKKGKYREEPDDESVVNEYPSEEFNPAEAYEISSNLVDVRKAIEALEMREREIVLMRIEGELSFKEIAAELSLPLGTVLTRMRNATMKLKKFLKEK